MDLSIKNINLSIPHNQTDNNLIEHNSTSFFYSICNTIKEYLNIYDRKIINFKPLQKPSDYFYFTDKYKILLMQDYLSDQTNYFTDDDWLYLIIKIGKRTGNETKLKIIKQEFNTINKELLFNKIAKLQSLRYQIEEITDKSSLKTRSYLYKQSKQNNYLFEMEKLQEIITFAKTDTNLFPCAKIEQLYSTASLSFGMNNPFFSDLIIACYRNSKFSPPEIAIGYKIEAELKNNTPKEIIKQDCLAVVAMLENKNIFKNICGGRTVQLNLPDGQILYLKFQRREESWNDFIREQQMHNTLYNLFTDQHFASEIPKSKFLFYIPIEKATSILNFKDKLEMKITENNCTFIYGYCFSASKDYVNYACQIDASNPYNQHAKSEEGLKKAAIDIGTYARYGLTFDSLIKAQHERTGTWDILHHKWMSLSEISGFFKKNSNSFPGSICDWIKDTMRSDLSWSGLRDLGDCQIIDNILPTLNKDNRLRTCFFLEIGNLLAYFNALMDNIVAIILVYIHGKRLNSSFHYQNTAAIQEVKIFLTEILQQIMNGYFATTDVQLNEIMNLTITDFEKWLHITSLEIIYWGAMQPHELTEDFYNSSYDHKNQNYTSHLKKNNKFDSNIMKMEDDKDISTLFLIGNSYENNNNYNYHFGVSHLNGFPLQALIKGINKLFTEILEQSSF